MEERHETDCSIGFGVRLNFLGILEQPAWLRICQEAERDRQEGPKRRKEKAGFQKQGTEYALTAAATQTVLVDGTRR